MIASMSRRGGICNRWVETERGGLAPETRIAGVRPQTCIRVLQLYDPNEVFGVSPSSSLVGAEDEGALLLNLLLVGVSWYGNYSGRRHGFRKFSRRPRK